MDDPEMKSIKTLTTKLFIASTMTACATTYQPLSLTGGFEELQISDNIFQVSFRANGFTSEVKSTDFALLRSAETTIEHGFNFFVINKSNNGFAETGSYSLLGPSPSGLSSISTTNGNFKPWMTNTITCFSERPTLSDIIYDAHLIRDSLKNKYALP